MDKWLMCCCATCEEEDSLEDALGFAYAVSQGDGHMMLFPGA
jgi:hypothetical protein